MMIMGMRKLRYRIDSEPEEVPRLDICRTNIRGEHSNEDVMGLLQRDPLKIVFAFACSIKGLWRALAKESSYNWKRYLQHSILHPDDFLCPAQAQDFSD